MNVTVTPSAAFASYACGSGTTVKARKGVDLVVLSPLALPLIAVNGPPVSASGPELTWAAGGVGVRSGSRKRRHHPREGEADHGQSRSPARPSIDSFARFLSLDLLLRILRRFDLRYAGWEVQPNLS